MKTGTRLVSLCLLGIAFILSCGKPISELPQQNLESPESTDSLNLLDVDSNGLRTYHYSSGYSILVRGSVRSSQGLVAGARVTGRLTWCHDSASATTSATGGYRLRFRAPFCNRDQASVRVCVEKIGFHTACRSRAFVNDGTTLTFNFNLVAN